jgi:malate dehydrogenase (quinone)
MLSTVSTLEQQPDKSWLVGIQKNHLAQENSMVRSKIVFAGAGGGTLRILQKAALPEVRGYAGMPVSGKFLVCQNPDIIVQNKNKVYSPAAVGAPPMSVPHLDWRTIYGRDCIFFGPFAGFKPTVFNNTGSPLDWLATLNPGNLMALVKTGLYNMDLVKYLVKELAASKQKQLDTLRLFVPDAKAEDWTMVWAGQRITTVHPNGALQFGTEVMSSKDKTLVGLLGASPGASVSPHIAIEVLDHFQAAIDNQSEWHSALAQMIPSYGRSINDEPGLYEKVAAKANDVLLYGSLSGFATAKRNIHKTFQRLDTSADGSLSYDEMRVFLSAQGVDAKSIDALIEKLDADKSGDISHSEFTAGFADFITGQLLSGKEGKKQEA